MDIQAITTLLCLLLLLMCWFLLLINFSVLQPLSWKVTFSGTQKPTPPTVFNLQALDWVHCEDLTGAHAGISRHTYKLVEKKRLTNFESCLFCPPKICGFKKKIQIFFSLFFKKKIFQHPNICTKCNDNFKFTISLKSYEE